MDFSAVFIFSLIALMAFFALRSWLAREQRKREEQERLRRLAERRAYLYAKYQDEQIVDAIMGGEVWQGMSEEQLIDCKGQPEDTSERVFKAKTVETFKYDRVGRGRYATRITLENGYVIGWDYK